MMVYPQSVMQSLHIRVHVRLRWPTCEVVERGADPFVGLLFPLASIFNAFADIVGSILHPIA